MIKEVRKGLKVVIAAVLCCGHPNIHLAQDPANSFSKITDNFQSIVTSRLQEKIYVHTDKSIYLTGETIWFKAYCVDGSTHRLSALTKVLNIEVIDDEGEPIEQTRIRLKGGIGKGQIFIGPRLVTGQYTLRAYTSWMRNFDEDFVFQKGIKIINASAPEKLESSAISDETLTIEFFAEGGQLVYGIRSRMAIKVTGSDGSGKPVTGTVYDNNQIKVAEFVTSERGLSSFFLLPETGQAYRAVITNDQGEPQTADIPQPKAAGYVITVAPEEGSFRISVGSKGQPDQSVYLIVHTRGSLKVIEEQRLTQGSGQFIVPKKSLGEGISHFTLMTSTFQPVCERLIFKFPEIDPDLVMETNKSSYANREKVAVHLESEQLAGDVRSNLSMSVYKSDENIKSDHESIVSNLLLNSDLKGYIENPDYYFAGEKENELDVLLMTHGWRRFLWDDVIAGEEPIILYPPEINSPVIAGKVISPGVEKKHQSVFLGFPGKLSMLSAVQLDPGGAFHFEVPFRMKNQTVIFWCKDDTLKSDGIELESSFILSSQAGKKSNSIEPNLKEYTEHSNANIQINHAYLNQTQISGITGTVSEVTTPFYGSPEVFYNLDNFTRFVEMREIFLEYIRSVSIKRREGKTYFHVIARRDMGGLEEFHLPALVLLDGVPFNDADLLLEIDPLKVEHIEVVNAAYQIGAHQFDGILNFITYKGDLAGNALLAGVIEKVYVGLQTPREFYSPKYSRPVKRQSRTPDFRNVLYWDPDITIGSGGSVNLEFYTSDDIGNYKIDLQGISSDGTPLWSELEIKVNSQL